MKFDPRRRYVIGAAIDPNASSHGDDLLQSIFLAFMHTACDGSLSEPGVPIDIVIWQEGAKRGSHTIGDASVQTLPTDMFETVIGMLEHGKSPVDRSHGAKELTILFGIGSSAFCQSFIHYVATNDDGMSAKSWGLHYMRKLTTAKLGDALWYDTATPGEFFCDDMKQMIRNFMQDFAPGS